MYPRTAERKLSTNFEDTITIYKYIYLSISSIHNKYQHHEDSEDRAGMLASQFTKIFALSERIFQLVRKVI